MIIYGGLNVLQSGRVMALSAAGGSVVRIMEFIVITMIKNIVLLLF